ncbi:MAG: metallophosphoesterase [Deltaproteobacteria bacterium]|nr:metallophosphoesterase [Deltaproteobacteria bacterium]
MRWILFFATFSTLYGGLHLYAFLKVRRGMGLGSTAGLTLAVFMVFMVFCPLIVRTLERWGLETIPRVLAYVGYLWMGLMFLFFCSSLVVDLWNVSFHLLGKVDRGVGDRLVLPARWAFLVPFLLSLIILIYGYFEALAIRTEHMRFETPKISAEMSGIRIAQISDVHLGLVVREGRLRRIMEAVQAEKPDIIVSTGDLVDGQIDHMNRLAELLREVKTRYGKFAVTGNHEFYAGLDRALDFMAKAGFTVLRGQVAQLPGGIRIAGVDDRAGRASGRMAGGDEKELLSGLDREAFTLLLKHRSEVEEDSSGLFDLQLSGHAHGGQIFPFSLIVKRFFPRDAGLFPIPGGGYLYVSRGSGTWGPPIRFLAPPEVTIIELTHSPSTSASMTGPAS